MNNPYLKPQSHRANVLVSLFTQLAVKIAAVFLILHSIADIPSLLDPKIVLVLAWLSLAFIFDLFTVYHLTTRWHRLDRHAWIVLPSALLNICWPIILMTPAFFAMAVAALGSVLPDAPWIPIATLSCLAVSIVIALLQLVASLRLMARLKPIPANF